MNTDYPAFGGLEIDKAIQIFCEAEKKSVFIRSTRVIRVPNVLSGFSYLHLSQSSIAFLIAAISNFVASIVATQLLHNFPSTSFIFF